MPFPFPPVLDLVGGPPCRGGRLWRPALLLLVQKFPQTHLNTTFSQVSGHLGQTNIKQTNHSSPEGTITSISKGVSLRSSKRERAILCVPTHTTTHTSPAPMGLNLLEFACQYNTFHVLLGKLGVSLPANAPSRLGQY